MTITIRPLNTELQKVAVEELNEVVSRIPEDVAAFRAWIEKQPHLSGRSNDQFLVAFLRGCKYSLEKAKSKYDYYYTIRTLMPEIFKELYMDEKNIDLCRSGFYVCLPKPLGLGGPRIQFSKYSNFDTKKYNMYDLFRYQVLVKTSQIRNDDNCIISGIIEVVDLEKTSFNAISLFQPMLVKKMSVFAEKGAPQRIKGVHLVNAPKEAHAILSLAKSFMSEKLQKRYHIHKSLEDLHKHIPKEYLPIEYGGTNGSIEDIQVETEKLLISLNDYFIEENKFEVNEKLRSGKKIDPESLFGTEGSFRKLEID